MRKIKPILKFKSLSQFLFKSLSQFLAFLLVLFTFQNCGQGFKANDSDRALQQAEAVQIDFDFSAKNQATLQVDRLNRVEEWIPANEGRLSVHPPFSVGSNRLNLDAAPHLENNNLVFDEGRVLYLSDYDLARLTSNQYTVFLVVSKVSLASRGSEKADATVRLFDVFPVDSTDQVGHLALDLQKVTENNVTKYRYRSIFWFDVNNYSVLDHYVDVDVLDKKHVIIMVFGKSKDQLRLLVDGRDTEKNPIIVGNPHDLGSVPRKLGISSSWASGSFWLHRMLVSLSAMNSESLNKIGYALSRDEAFSFTSVSPGKDIEGVEPEGITYSQLMGSGNRAVFKNHCVGCHNSVNPSGGLNLENKTQAQQKAAVILSRIEGTSGAIMPPSGKLPGPLRSYLRNWVNSRAP